MDKLDIEKILKIAPKPYIPPKLPIDLAEIYSDVEIINLSVEANRKFGMYNGFLFNILNPNLLVSPLISQEATLSSKLEGTHATIEDVLNYNAGAKVEIEEDEMKEVLNYRRALNYAVDNMRTIDSCATDKLPLSNRLIKNIHSILLNNVRGSKKNPGEFKKMQNYIGSASTINFTPLPPERTNEYMSNLENFIHDETIDPLIQAALIHAQFEMIHPFQDGNGRIGRLLIPLFFYYRGLLVLPTFYMSKYFESDRSLYIQKLSEVSVKNDYKDWIKYFLTGVIEQSEENTLKAKYLLDEYERIKIEALENINSQYIIPVIDFMFKNPAFNVNQLIEEINMSKNTAYNIIEKLVDLEILSHNNLLRNKIYYVDSIFNFLIRE